MKYRIVSDSSSNVNSLPGSIEYRTAPLKIVADGKEFADVEGLDVIEMVNAVEASRQNSSSCPNNQEWIDAFEGADCIFAVTITGTISGSYNSAMLARQEFLQSHPEANIYVVNSLSTGGEMELIINRLRTLMEQNLSYQEIVDAIEDYQKHTHLIFALESLNNLAKNGRCPKAFAKLAGILNLRFVGTASEQGTLKQEVIARGLKKTISAMYKRIMELGYKGGEIVIGDCLNPEGTNELKNLILERYPQARITTRPLTGLCSYYAERGGMIVGFEDL